ncbi:MAG: hypothetical protein M3T49_09220 [Candidatus Eremiobacteraeota bacterium]|nr:hypothetical protein [Candidatus Eremiobacteraeota bacterium]
MQQLSLGSIRTRRLEITDSKDRTAAQIGCDQDDAPVMRLLDTNGKPRAVIGLQEGKPHFRLMDDQGRVRLCLILRDNVPGIEFMDHSGGRRILLYLTSQNGQNPDLFFVDSNNKVKFGLTMLPDGSVKVIAQDKLGRLVEPIWFASDLTEDNRPIQ